ncbi:MAG: glycosyltransferase family 39 protein [Candidatus Marsarchaeota archaeon]|nr:glycosyltransferase family 39 protein [Candidatus Marsarchaeota archaeon]
MIAAVALVFLLLVPGLVTLAAVGTKLRKRMQLDLLESALLACLVGVVIVGWVAFLLAEFGFFSLPLLVLAVVTYSVAVAAFRWRELVSSHLRIWQRLRRDTLLVICLLVLAGVLFLRPFEYVLGGRDPGVYAITGVNIARTGAILVKDTEVANLPMEYRDVLFGEPPEPGMPASRQVGFYLRDLSGTVEPHGFHLFPVWIAILYSLGGLAFALYTTPVFGLLGILALYCLGRRVFNPWVGLLAAFFLTVNAITLWFARYPAAEMLTQFLFLSGMWAFVILLDTPSKPLAIFSGLALGLVHLTKIELFLLPVALFLYLVWLWLRGCFRGEYWYFVVAYLVLLVQALMHAIFIATTYTLNVIFSMAPALLSNTPGATRIDQPHQQILLNLLFVAHWKTTLGILLFMGATLFIASRQRMRIERLISRILRHEAKIRLLGVFIVGLSLVYAYYLRPTLGERHDLPFPFLLLAAALSDRRYG